MLTMIADWQHRGRIKKAYCMENGINKANFYYWLSCSKENDTSSGSFITIDKAARKNDIEVIYPNGVRIKIERMTLLDYDGCVHVFMQITDGKMHESQRAGSYSFPKGSVVVVDRGYLDIAGLGIWTAWAVTSLTGVK